jgi:hypothetical protein
MIFVKLRSVNLPATMTSKISHVSNRMVCFNLKKVKEEKFLDLNMRYKYGQIAVKQIVKRLIVVIVINLRILINDGYIAKQERQFTYTVNVRPFRVTIAAVKLQ